MLGLAEELKPDGIAVNALWPRTTIATAAIRNVLGGEAVVRMSRTPDIVADAAHLVLRSSRRKRFTGHFLIDDSFLYEAGGVTDFAAYSVVPGAVAGARLLRARDAPGPARRRHRHRP